MQEEFRQAYAVLKEILFERHDVTPWERLFQPQHFFEVAKGWYVQVSRRQRSCCCEESYRRMARECGPYDIIL